MKIFKHSFLATSMMAALFLMTVILFQPQEVYAGTKSITINVGETINLYPRQDDYDYANRAVYGGGWVSYGSSYVQVVSDPSTYYSCQIKAIKPTSSPIIVRLDYYYTMNVGGYTRYASGYVDYKITVNDVVFNPSQTEVTVNLAGGERAIYFYLGSANSNLKVKCTSGNNAYYSVSDGGRSDQKHYFIITPKALGSQTCVFGLYTNNSALIKQAKVNIKVVCYHSYTEEVIKSPTETTEGEKKCTCTVCGDTKIETIERIPYEDTAQKLLYKVTNSEQTGGTVTLLNTTSKDITEVIIPTTVNIKGISYKVTEISENAFVNCKKLQKVTIGTNIEKIGQSSFYNCSELFSVIIESKNISEIGKNAFKNLKSECEIVVPAESYTTYDKLLKESGISEDVKIKKSLIQLNQAKVELKTNSYVYDGSAKTPDVVSVVLGDQMLVTGTDYTVSYVNNTNVGTATVIITGRGNYSGTVEKTFTIKAASLSNAVVTLKTISYTYNGKAKKPGVKSVVLDKRTLVLGTDFTVSYKNNKNIGTATVVITGIGNYNGSASKTFDIRVKKGKVIDVGKYKYKVTGISTVAFNGIKSTKTTKVTIPKTVKYGGKTFKVTSIADKALKGKTKVTQVTIGANVKTIGVSAFEGCKKLSKITFGSAATTIEDKAFKNCVALTNITIPSKVTKIDKQAFYGCKKLKTITIKSTKLKTVGKNALKGINSKATIKVPKSKLSAYKKLLKGKGQGSKVKIVKYN